MVPLAVLDQLNDLLDADDSNTSPTSMRLPTSLREAAALAVDHLDLAVSTTALTSEALRSVLETAVMRAALDAHYEQYPSARPTLGEIAVALAQQVKSPLADQPERLARASEQILTRHADADAHDVLLWAEAQELASA